MVQIGKFLFMRSRQCRCILSPAKSLEEQFGSFLYCPSSSVPHLYSDHGRQHPINWLLCPELDDVVIKGEKKIPESLRTWVSPGLRW